MAPFAIKIPEDAYPGLTQFVSLKDEEFKVLLDGIRATEPTFYPSKFAVAVSKGTGLDNDIVREIISFVIPLFALRYDIGVSVSEFVNIFIDAINQLSFDLELPNNTNDIIAARLPEILSLEPSLGIVSKAGNVTFRHERTMVESQIFTELRPIFQEDAEQPPVAGVILHKLRLTYVEDNKSREFFITMDAEDVEKLRRALDRADKKARSLRALLDQTTMHVLEMNADE